MINGFEKETHELTNYEMTLVPIIVKGFIGKHGSSAAVKNKTIVTALKAMGEKVTEPRIRKIIHHIRVKHLVTNLISTNKGTYRAESKEELIKYVESLQQRINSIEEIKKSFNINQ